MSAKLKYFLLSAYLFCHVNFLFAQLIGKIVDENNRPLEYATAAIYNNGDKALVTGVVTDINGVFVFDNLEKGAYYIEVSFIGYESRTISDIIISNLKKTTDLGSVKLSLGNTLNEVVVKAERAAVVNKIDRQIFDARKFKSAQGGSGIDVVRNLPSVSVESQGEINVRCSSGFVVLLNSKPIQGNAA